MRLRDVMRWFYERFCRFFIWFGESSDLSNDEAEKRERLIQTYLVVFGLLLSYSGYPDLQAGLMVRFIGFLMASLTYYSMLTRSAGSKHIRNLLVLTMASIFSSAFVSCYVAFSGYFVGIWILFCIIVYVVARPLLV